MNEATIGLAPVGRDTVQDRVYQELRRALVGGLFAPGQVLTIRQLADALATSTMPVRDAVGRLITEQALEILPNRSIRIPPVTAERIADLLRARILIETDAPYLTPMPYRGRPNSSYLLPHTLRAMATYLGTDPSMLGAQISSNTELVYGHWDDEPVTPPAGPFDPHPESGGAGDPDWQG